MLKRTISLRRFFWVPTTCFGWEIRKIIFSYTFIWGPGLLQHFSRTFQVSSLYSSTYQAQENLENTLWIRSWLIWIYLSFQVSSLYSSTYQAQENLENTLWIRSWLIWIYLAWKRCRLRKIKVKELLAHYIVPGSDITPCNKNWQNLAFSHQIVILE